MKKFRVLLVLVLIVVSSFHVPLYADEKKSVPSEWAVESVNKMIEFNIVPEIYQDYYQAHLTRGEAALFIYNYISMQYGLYDFYDFYNDYLIFGETELPVINTIPINEFQDLDQWCPGSHIMVICSLGIMTGVTDEEFKPHETISLNEVLDLLLKTYSFYADQSTLDMNKYREILNLNQVYGDTPDETAAVSREEFLVMLYNLYKNAPVSRLNKNVEPLLSVDTLYNYLKNNPILGSFREIETDEHIVLLCVNGIGMPRWGENVLILYKYGGMKGVDIYGWSHSESYFTGVSEDQSLLYINIRYKMTDLDTIYTINLNTGHIYKDY